MLIRDFGLFDFFEAQMQGLKREYNSGPIK